MKTSSALIALVLAGSAAGWSWTAGRQRFNAEEHKLIGDRGVAAVVIPASVRLPAGVVFEPVAAEDYVARIRVAKQLAVGFDTNDRHDYDPSAPAVQDNCYSTAPINIYKQSEYNLNMLIPAASEAPANVLWVAGHANRDAAHAYSFGELVGFYGDYRQVPYCDGAICYMTNADITEVRFLRGPLVSAKSCPPPMPAGHFLERVASGLVPPFGTLGNAVFNTAKGVTDYWDAGWWGDEMLRIAKVNDWHFSRSAVAWYVGMHRLALLYADSARAHPDYWVKALHYEANALHSLTDLFVFGHVVTSSDETSHAIVESSHLADAPVYRWMENVIAMGGGRRGENGRVQLSASLPALADYGAPRNVLLETKPAVPLGLKKVAEMLYHDTFNQSGATVRNLRGDEFMLFGDGGLATMFGLDPAGVAAASGAVTASVQSLFDAYDVLSKGYVNLEQLSADTAYFAALRYLPVYVVRDPHNYFTGRWTLYAHAINQLSGARRTLNGWPECQVALISGAGLAATLPELVNLTVTGEMLAWPTPQEKPCAMF